jgi:hypothetical protein
MQASIFGVLAKTGRAATLCALLVTTQAIAVYAQALPPAQPWTAVGSTGVIVSGTPNYDCYDQAIGFFHRNILISPASDCLSSPVIKPGPRAKGSSFNDDLRSKGRIVLIGVIPPAPSMPTGSARVLYNVVAEPDIVTSSGVQLTVRFLITDTFDQHLLVRLFRQPLDSSQNPSSNPFLVTNLISLNANSYGPNLAPQTQILRNCVNPVTLDFNYNAYYVVADISNSFPHGYGLGVYQVRLEKAFCGPG